MSHGCLFIDNGGYSLKAMFVPQVTSGAHRATDAVKTPYVVVPNAVGASSSIGRGIVGTTLSTLNQYHSLLLRRPMDQGLLVDGELQAFIWDSILQHFTILDEHTVDLVFTVSFSMPDAVIEQWVSVLTVAFRFHSVTIVSSSFLALIGAEALGGRDGGSGVVLDCGYSCTTVTPYVAYRPLRDSIGRTIVAGKLLTNCLKEALSFSQVNLLEDTWIVNCIKEACCSVLPSGGPSALRDAYDSLHAASKRPRDEAVGCAGASFVYALPTVPAAMPAGCVAQPAQLRGPFRDAQTVKISHEGFVIPEILFSPADIGLESSLGVAQTYRQVVDGQRTLFSHLSTINTFVSSNTVVFGGTTNLPGFVPRMEREIVATSQTTIMHAPPTVHSTLGTSLDGQGSAVLNILGVASPKSIRHRTQELLPLVGAKILLTSSKGRWVDLKAEMMRRGHVLCAGGARQSLDSFQAAMLSML